MSDATKIGRALPRPISPIVLLPDERRHALLKLMAEAPGAVAELTGLQRGARQVLRWAISGSHGVLLRTITVCRTRMTTRQWLMDFFESVDHARRKGGGTDA